MWPQKWPLKGFMWCFCFTELFIHNIQVDPGENKNKGPLSAGLVCADLIQLDTMVEMRTYFPEELFRHYFTRILLQI